MRNEWEKGERKLSFEKIGNVIIAILLCIGLIQFIGFLGVAIPACSSYNQTPEEEQARYEKYAHYYQKADTEEDSDDSGWGSSKKSSYTKSYSSTNKSTDTKSSGSSNKSTSKKSYSSNKSSSNKSSSSTKKKSDYDDSYNDYEDFYYDNEEDFDGLDEAEVYYDEYYED